MTNVYASACDVAVINSHSGTDIGWARELSLQLLSVSLTNIFQTSYAAHFVNNLISNCFDYGDF